MTKVIMDCDPGIDDAIALTVLLAHQTKADLIGVTTVGGNVKLDYVTKNAKKLLTFLGSHAELASGQATPLVKEIETAGEIHGKTGMDGYDFPKDSQNYPLTSTNAVTYMYDRISKSDEKVNIVATAPLTNIALLLKTFPDVKENIEHIYIMGGSTLQGNITLAAEFNAYVDPEAMDIVFNSKIPITLSGLNLTENKAYLTMDEIGRIKDLGPVGVMASSILDFYAKAELEKGMTKIPIHDACAVISLIAPELFTKSTNYSMDVSLSNDQYRGMTYPDRRTDAPHKNSIKVLEDVDREAFVKFLFDSIQSYDK
ncbi:nucleoside hydrolase [Companilactobacillus alimentarius]|uniref:Nucleoside hydrolase n=1 Tax=Companilactobacillus alimentarius DSM 20249 TaxID=1423720 RepID=A0A2K9HLU2_9LACO|nr:nucleoside hydrolase [Companilactobacillus alimentarius]AUI72015.1 nucleoside hydrolase [Companilactobacillus alimentarius DSM 20249]KRK77968.1 inosine uridine-preferring nucleoside hydrolase [Companilactobacillus alimentarius DSM 20249]MDT6952550.1 nucleoside hydrolase [Companilactobacillus alimentarius]GEO44786.1 ribonucleoside hydrolase RihC [Companilactobacillus alimentarius]